MGGRHCGVWRCKRGLGVGGAWGVSIGRPVPSQVGRAKAHARAGPAAPIYSRIAALTAGLLAARAFLERAARSGPARSDPARQGRWYRCSRGRGERQVCGPYVTRKAGDSRAITGREWQVTPIWLCSSQ